MKRQGTQTLVVQVAPAHKATLRALAQQNAEPMAVVVRRLIREEAERRGLWPLAEPPERPQEVSHAR